MIDIYAEVRHLAFDLKRANKIEEASEILSALQEGSTATEILMILRYRIQTLIKNQVALDTDVLSRSKLIVDEINRIC